MIQKTIQTIQGKVKIAIPTSLAEITIGQMMDMESAISNSIPLIPELTEDIVNNITNYSDLIDIRERILSLAHKIKYEYHEAKLPEYIHVLGKRIKVIKNLSIEPAGAYLACRDIIADEINAHIAIYGEDKWQDKFTPSLKTCSLILAHYFYCHVTGLLWNEQKAEEFQSEILKLSVQEALPVARFFIMKYPDLSQSRRSLWQVFKLILRKNLALRRLRNSNISTQ